MVLTPDQRLTAPSVPVEFRHKGNGIIVTVDVVEEDAKYIYFRRPGPGGKPEISWLAQVSYERVTSLPTALRSLQAARATLADAAEGEAREACKKAVGEIERLVATLRREAKVLVVSHAQEMRDYLPLDAISYLIGRSILAECEECETLDTLSDVYMGPHREFHPPQGHNWWCISKALHEYDPALEPVVLTSTKSADGCEACGIGASQKEE